MEQQLQAKQQEQAQPAKKTQSKKQQQKQESTLKHFNKEYEGLTEEEIEQKIQAHMASLKNPCQNCKQQESQYVVRRLNVCEECYLKKVQSRVYQYIRGNKPIGYGDKILLAFVGEYEPTELVFENQKVVKAEPRARDFSVLQAVLGKARNGTKILNEVEILYVDLGCQKSKEIVLGWGQEYNIKVTQVKVQDLFENLQKLAEFLRLFKDQDEALKILKYNVIMNSASKMDFKFVFLSDCGQDIAKSTFSMLSQGRGLSLINEINAISQLQYHGKTFTVLRILKDLVDPEVQTYYEIRQKQKQQQQNNNNNLNQKMENLEINDQQQQEEQKLIFDPKVAHIKNKKPTIENILDNFFDKLQISFPQTVHTAIRALDKVRDKFEIQETCFLCLGKMDKIVNQLELDSYEDLHKSKVQEIKQLCFGCMRMLKNSNSDIETILKALPEIIQQNKQQ